MPPDPLNLFLLFIHFIKSLMLLLTDRKKKSSFLFDLMQSQDSEKLMANCGDLDMESGFFSYYILSMRCKSMQHRGRWGKGGYSAFFFKQKHAWIFWHCITIRSKCLMPLFLISQLVFHVASSSSSAHPSVRQKAIPCARLNQANLISKIQSFCNTDSPCQPLLSSTQIVFQFKNESLH